MLILLNFLMGCGYQPLLDEKQRRYSIESFIVNDEGDVRLGQILVNSIGASKSDFNKLSLNIKNFVCASDGFFPFNDSISLLAKNNCSVIAQPSGSLNDNNSIKFAIKNKISLYFIKFRLFKH